MKKWSLFLAAYFCLCLALGGCGAAGGSGAGAGGAVPGGAVGADDAPAGSAPAESARPAGEAETFRIVDTGGAPPLLLAKADGTGGDVYYLNDLDCDVTLDGRDTAAMDFIFQPGALLDVVYDSVLETYPGQLSGVTAVNLRSDGFDDRCALYLSVLEDLWAVDSGLNEGITELGVDLSATSLSESEQAAVAVAFGSAHGIMLIQGTYEELAEQGYITGEPLEGTSARFCQWTDGCLFSITEREPKPFNQTAQGFPQNTVSFDAQKWRSGTGACYFADCTAAQGADGRWGAYTVGAQAIS